mgnify:CR=1 FL=1
MWKTVKRRCGAWLFGWIRPALQEFLEAWANQYTQDVVVRALREYEWRHAGRAVCDCPIRYIDRNGRDIAGEEVIASKDRTHKRTYHGKIYSTCRQDHDGYWVYIAEE